MWTKLGCSCENKVGRCKIHLDVAVAIVAGDTKTKIKIQVVKTRSEKSGGTDTRSHSVKK